MKCHLKYYILLKEEIIHNWFIQQKKGNTFVFPFFYACFGTWTKFLVLSECVIHFFSKERNSNPTSN